jgi:hypothetical protein
MMTQDATAGSPEEWDVAHPTQWYLSGQAHRELPATLMGHTFAMRLKGRTYLPQNPGEEASEYKARLETSVQNDAYPRAVEWLAGKVFAKPLRLEDDVPIEIRGTRATKGKPTGSNMLSGGVGVVGKLLSFLRRQPAPGSSPAAAPPVADVEDATEGWAEDVDEDCRNLHSYALSWFMDATALGASYTLIDYEAGEVTPNAAGAVSRAAQKASGGRPYLVLLHADQVIEWTKERVGGKLVPVRVRVKGCEMERVGRWGEQKCEWVRVFYRGGTDENPGQYCRCDCYEKEDGKWPDSPTESCEMAPQVEIPIVPYPGPDELPWLENLANLMQLHWIKRSELDAFFAFAKIPIPCGYGLSDKEVPKVIGANRWITTEKGPTEAKVEIVEAKGTAIALAMKDLEDIEREARLAAYEPLLPQARITETATSKRIDTAAANSALLARALIFADRMETVLQFVAIYMGLESGGSVTVNDNFGFGEAQLAVVNALLEMRKAGDLSWEGFVEQMIIQEVLSEDFNPIEEAARIADEKKAKAANAPPPPPPGARAPGAPGAPTPPIRQGAPPMPQDAAAA